jgi:hypothetical protein
MSDKKDVFCPEYRLIPSSLKEKFSSGEFDVKALFLVSELSYEVLKREGPQRHLPQDRTRDFLRGMLSNAYRSVVEELRDAGIIQVRRNKLGKESYSTEHHHSKQYSLTKKYRDELIQDGVSGVLVKDHRQLKRIHNFFSKSTEVLLKKHDWLKTEVEAMKRLHFQKELADRFLKKVADRHEFREKQLTERVRHDLIRSTNAADNFLNSSRLPHISLKHGRVYHKLANIHKELREFITTDAGEQLVEIDMRSAQWVTLCRALAFKQKNNYSRNLIENLSKHINDPIHVLENTYNDVHAFARAVLLQDIYTELGLLKESDCYAMSSDWNHPMRDELKKESIAKTLYSYFTNPEENITIDGWYLRSVKSVLQANYPTVYNFLVQCAQESTSKKRSQGLAILMQNYEGYFFHRVLQEGLNEVLKGCGYVIIHDAVFVPESKAQEALKVAKNAALEWFGDDQMFSL